MYILHVIYLNHRSNTVLQVLKLCNECSLCILLPLFFGCHFVCWLSWSSMAHTRALAPADLFNSLFFVVYFQTRLKYKYTRIGRPTDRLTGSINTFVHIYKWMNWQTTCIHIHKSNAVKWLSIRKQDEEEKRICKKDDACWSWNIGVSRKAYTKYV